MTALQYFMLGFSGLVIAVSAYMFVRTIRGEERYRLVEIPVLVTVMVWLAVDTVRPALIQSAPSFVHWYSVVVGSGLVTAETLRSLWVLFRERKVSVIERR